MKVKVKGFKSFYNRYTKAENFSPHSFETKIEMMSDVPKILISKVAYAKMWHYVDIAGEEVGWLGTVEKIPGALLIKDVFLLKQKVSSAQTTITEEGLTEFGEEILQLPDGVDIYNNIRFWGHSHVNMGTSPSGQDESQMEIFKGSEHPYFIRGILNKRGRMEFTIFFYENGIKIEDAEWAIYEPVDASIRENIEAEFKEKVTKETYNYKAYSPYVSPYASPYQSPYAKDKEQEEDKIQESRKNTSKIYKGRNHNARSFKTGRSFQTR